MGSLLTIRSGKITVAGDSRQQQAATQFCVRPACLINLHYTRIAVLDAETKAYHA